MRPITSSKTPYTPPSKKPVQQRSLWESYAVLPAKTRLKISLAVTLVAAGGIYLSNKLEEAIPATEEDKARLPGHHRPAPKSTSESQPTSS
ncbi:hypothetical protein K474DRAFT_1711787 [Panus rudis PR-1116 ss-1]|nr:hypothetical protein K474DRAFT_1711787 [Panus rudis PR-1116 ss-1]